MPLLDKQGNTIYLLTNTTAAWARDGMALPWGSGTVTGIIVNETCDNYEWDSATAAMDSRLADYVTGLGNIGRYQIRPQHRSDIALDGEPFTKILCEWTSFADVKENPALHIRPLNSGRYRRVRTGARSDLFPVLHQALSLSRKALRGWAPTGARGTMRTLNWKSIIGRYSSRPRT